jgi:V8-like Glu-specific endopeptidase
VEHAKTSCRRALPVLLVTVAALTAVPASGAREAVPPTAQVVPVAALGSVDVLEVPALDRAALAAEDEERDRQGLAPRYAVPNEVAATPASAGTWEDVGGGVSLWRLRITSPGASSINLGFSRYVMPKGGRLMVYAADMSHVLLPFTAGDNADHGELWTPVVSSDHIVVEVTVATKAVPDLDLRLSFVNVGYRGFESLLSRAPGSCNIDVVCPQGDGWRDDIRSVGVISTGGSLFCTGFMVNNTAADATPYFMTANHCGITSGNAASLVVYWNYESPTCGQLGGGPLSDYQTGSYFRSAYASSDFTLVELDSDPDPSWGVTFAGWSRADVNARSATAIHQPDADVKCISFEYDATQITTYLQTTSPGDATHLRVVDWDVGTTEPGSSGSPLFDQDHRVVGQLHGGYAACGNNSSDWYGRFFKSWTGGGTNATRLSNWLDPGSTGAATVDLLDPFAAGLRVTPSPGLVSSGDAGGPFTPGSAVYTLENQNDTGIDYSVTKTESWITLTNASGHLNGHATVDVTVSVNSNANLLGNGSYGDVVQFVNLTDHVGDTSRSVSLRVGVPELVYSYPFDATPGWTVQGLWAFGRPTGSGGQYGGPDPTGGRTGTNVYGYNLSGDYENNLAERHLTSTAIDCTGLSSVTVKFWRWLGVEQSAYDHAYLRVSNDGTNWTTVWQNGPTLEESSWTQQSYDISAIADDRPTVYLRWTMGTTDGSWRYCGWNIDDVEVWGVRPSLSDVPDDEAVSALSLSPNHPNPFTPPTSVRFTVPQRTEVSLAVYDVAGRLVRTLVDGEVEPGEHAVTWDGRHASGAEASSGVYFCRLSAMSVTRTVSMALVR